ncbi:uncharacterized protein LTR77_009314 [Saxophila tyrrhenica]|uniref:NAD-dependent epimerase/dehydratase domain-containing protein n=1 Tax=Saxophila tyrrhenica TaxID=1690608 RepID=A0AAV9NYP6_9PEZI|nr:hypothetical protein LTR77_009314 [Saxophila tyrrhenica]
MLKELVLVTGTTGHLGFRTLVFTLQHGFKARVPLRKLEQADKLKATASLKPFLDDVEFVHVPDITSDGAYGENIQGVDYVIHVASPVYSAFGAGETDWKKLMYEPAEKGVLNILKAASKEPRVKRVVITSSIIVIEPKNGAERAGPHDIKPLPSPQKLASAPNAPAAYVLSKTLAHVRSTEYIAQHNPHYALICILPGYIQGPNELYTSAEQMRDPSRLGSNEGTMLTALGLAPGAEKVRHLDNILTVGNGGMSTPWRDVVGLVMELFPEEVERGVLRPGTLDEEVVGDAVDLRGSEEKVGFEFGGMEKWVPGLVGQYLELLKE